MEKYVPDVSALECGVLPDLISQGKVRGKILISQSVLREVERRTRLGDFRAVNGLRTLRKVAEEAGVPL